MKLEVIKQIFTIQNIIIYVLLINLVTFSIMWYDKHEAKNGDWRVSEKTLFILALIGGSVGGFLGMHVFHHKTKKWYFKYGFPIIIAVQIFLVVYFIINNLQMKTI